MALVGTVVNQVNKSNEAFNFYSVNVLLYRYGYDTDALHWCWEHTVCKFSDTEIKL